MREKQKSNTNLIYFNNLIVWQKCINPKKKNNDERMGCGWAKNNNDDDYDIIIIYLQPQSSWSFGKGEEVH